MCSKRAIGIIGVIVLSLAMIALIYSVFSRDSLNWFNWSVVLILSLAATLIGFNIVSIDRSVIAVKESFMVRRNSWTDNIKQGIYHLLLGLVMSIIGAIFTWSFFFDPTEFTQWYQDVPSPFNILVFSLYVLLVFCVPFGLYLIYVAFKILIITIRRYRDGDFTFNNQQWTRFNIF